MKKATLTLIACMFIVTALEGCQTTPEQPIVIQKDMEQMIEKAQEQAEAVPQTEQLAEKLGVPERYTAEYAYSDRFTMTADAKIILPNVTALPTVRVKPADFSQEMVNQLYAYLVGDTVLYERQTVRTKAEIEQDIVAWQKTLADKNASEEAKAQAVEKIEKLKEAYRSAPDSTGAFMVGSPEIKTLAERDFLTGEELYTYRGVDLVERPEEAQENCGMYFQIRQNNTGDEILIEETVGGFSVTDTASRGALFLWSDYDLLKQAQGGTLGYTVEMGAITQAQWEQLDDPCGAFSPEQAQAETEKLLAYIDAEDMSVASIEMEYRVPEAVAEELRSRCIYNTEYEAAVRELLVKEYSDQIKGISYRVNCVRTVNNVSVTSDQLSSYVDDAYSKQWYYEQMSISLCEEGIFSVQWRSPHEIIETVAPDTAMLSFAEIAEIIPTMFRVKNEPQGEVKAEYKIERVVLSLRRIMEQNNVENGLLVPVWDLYGSAVYTYPGEPPVPDTYQGSQLTINAIDGSVIDLNRGY